MSIVRVGMSEDEKFGEGYDAIFGKKGATAKQPAAKGAKAPAAKPAPKAPANKKGAAKKK